MTWVARVAKDDIDIRSGHLLELFCCLRVIGVLEKRVNSENVSVTEAECDVTLSCTISGLLRYFDDTTSSYNSLDVYLEPGEVHVSC